MNRETIAAQPFPPKHGLPPSTEIFRLIAENLNAVFWVRDLSEGDLLYISPAYEKIWGAPRDEWYQRPESWMEKIHPADLPRIRRRHSEPVTGEACHEYRIIRHDGLPRWIKSKVLTTSGPQAPFLEIGIAEDITDFRHLQEQSRQAERRFRAELEQEQKRVARDLHDEFGQILPLLRNQVERLCRDQDEETQAIIGNLLSTMSGIVRRTINRLRPELLEHLGLRPSIEEKLREFDKCHPAIDTAFAVIGQPCKIEPTQEMELYRVFLEALTNAAKHAACDLVSVRLIFAFPTVILEIRDNGKGFDPEQSLDHPNGGLCGLGMHSMRERMESIGGSLGIKSAAGKGTSVRAEVTCGQARSGPDARRATNDE